MESSTSVGTSSSSSSAGGTGTIAPPTASVPSPSYSPTPSPSPASSPTPASMAPGTPSSSSYLRRLSYHSTAAPGLYEDTMTAPPGGLAAFTAPTYTTFTDPTVSVHGGTPGSPVPHTPHFLNYSLPLNQSGLQTQPIPPTTSITDKRYNFPGLYVIIRDITV